MGIGIKRQISKDRQARFVDRSQPIFGFDCCRPIFVVDPGTSPFLRPCVSPTFQVPAVGFLNPGIGLALQQ
uniref:Uncharacterized protein n=1 Tax=Oryza rufipogon TaxID=4529 RepID=A0A0E0R3D5_ORYRU